MKRSWLKELRKKRSLTQAEVASRSFIERSYYAQIENGTKNPSIDVARNIANVLHFNPALFFTENLSEPFKIAFQDIPIVIAHCDSDLRYTWIFNPSEDFSEVEIIGKNDIELSNNDGTQQLYELKHEVITKGEKLNRIISFPLRSGVQTFIIFCNPLVGMKSNITGVVTVAIDITLIEDDLLEYFQFQKLLKE